MGPMIVPCGIPLITSVHSEKKSFINLRPTLCFLKHKKYLIQYIILGSTLYNFNFCSRSCCGTLSNAYQTFCPLIHYMQRTVAEHLIVHLRIRIGN